MGKIGKSTKTRPAEAMTPEARIVATRRLVPQFLRAAERVHRDRRMVYVAVVAAWTGIAGVHSPSPEMVDYVGRRMKGEGR